jgi:hypothetical protein
MQKKNLLMDGLIVHGCRIGRHANVAQESIRVPRRNIHAAAESNRQMSEITADADALFAAETSTIPAL